MSARALAQRHFANHNEKGDREIPVFRDGKVSQIDDIKVAWRRFAEAGFFAAKYDFAEDGIQLPEPVLRAAMSYFCAANVATTGYILLTSAAIDLLRRFGTDAQRSLYMRPMVAGRFAGTMAMTEPNQGSSLSDLTTTAERHEDGSYRIRGQKIFISGGDQAITENIVHLVLARIKGAPAGTKGISLFVCPKYLVSSDGSLGARNDVELLGLLHKMGYRNTTSTLLGFGQTHGAVASLVGEENQGLRYMFHMMHQARIAVGTGAAAVAYQGLNYSVDYARERRQGRLPSLSNSACAQVRIIEHADVRRMLLAQKAYAEGALALCLFAAVLHEDSETGESETRRADAAALLNLLTPIVKSWPAKYGVRSNDLAIQILGGAGYTQDHPVEQYFRDQRLNPIHEGVEAVHAVDLLRRRVRGDEHRAFNLFVDLVREDIVNAIGQSEIASLAEAVSRSLDLLTELTKSLSETIDENIDLGLANATLYLHVFGHVVLAWIWLKQATCASLALTHKGAVEDRDFYSGKLHAARYFIEWELPEIGHQAQLLRTANAVCFHMKDNWF